MPDKPSCPRCESDDVVEIVYGYPSPKMEEKARSGEIELGGCLVSSDGTDFDLTCRQCDFRFYDVENKTATEIENAIDWMKELIENTRERIEDRRDQFGEDFDVSREQEQIEGFEHRLTRLEKA